MLITQSNGTTHRSVLAKYTSNMSNHRPHNDTTNTYRITRLNVQSDTWKYRSLIIILLEKDNLAIVYSVIPLLYKKRVCDIKKFIYYANCDLIVVTTLTKILILILEKYQSCVLVYNCELVWSELSFLNCNQ